MITRRTAVELTGRSFFSPVLLLTFGLVVLVLVVLPVSSSAFEVLHTAASVNDSLSFDAAVSVDAATSTAPPPEFVPTDEWQTVQPGQPIPPGLWVRMDLQTGEKTARLLPNDDDSRTADQHSEQLHSAGLVLVSSADGEAASDVYESGDGEERESSRQSESYSSEDAPIPVTVLSTKEDTSAGTLAAAALDLPPSTFSNPTPAQLAALKAARAARLREIAEAFQPTDDLAIIKQLLTIIMMGGASTAEDEEAVGVDGVLQAMELLESLVHQILDASKLHRSLPSSLISNQQLKDSQAGQEVGVREQAWRLSALQEKAAWLLGTAAQNNPTVKREAMKEQTIHILLQLLDHTELEVQRVGAQAERDDEMRDAWRRVQAKALYALSSLLRSFPEAQSDFHQRRGSDRLLSLLTSTASSAPSIDKQQHTVYAKTINLLSDLVQDRLINDVNASSSTLFDQLTDQQWCGVFHNISLHTTPLLNQAAAPSTSLSLSVSLLKTADAVLGIVQLLTKHQLCLPTFASSAAFRAYVVAQTAELDKRLSELTAEDDSLHYHYQQLVGKLLAIAALLTPAASASSSSSTVNETASLHSSISVLGVPLIPCSSSPVTGYHRDSYCRHDPNDGGRHLICAQLTDRFLSYSQQRGNDLITPRAGFEGLKGGDKWCVCAERWKEALQAGVAPGVLLAATNVRAEEAVSRQALLNHAVVEGPSIAE